MIDEHFCDNCPYNAKLLHKDMPFGCFNSWCDEPSSSNKRPIMVVSTMKQVQDEWIKTHPHWKGKPHIKWWYYETDAKKFDEFLKMYPDREHAPNKSWESMYDIIVLK